MQNLRTILIPTVQIRYQQLLQFLFGNKHTRKQTTPTIRLISLTATRYSDHHVNLVHVLLPMDGNSRYKSHGPTVFDKFAVDNEYRWHHVLWI